MNERHNPEPDSASAYHSGQLVRSRRYDLRKELRKRVMEAQKDLQ
jgi:hypothetical protein